MFKVSIPDDDHVCLKHAFEPGSMLYKAPRMTLVEEFPYTMAFDCLKQPSKDMVDRIVNAGTKLELDHIRESKVISLATLLCDLLELDSFPTIIRDRAGYDDVIRAVTYQPGSNGYKLANQVQIYVKDLIVTTKTEDYLVKEVRLSFERFLESLSCRVSRIPHHFSTPYLSFDKVSLLAFREKESGICGAWDVALQIYELGYGITGFNSDGQLSLADLKKPIMERKLCYEL